MIDRKQAIEAGEELARERLEDTILTPDERMLIACGVDGAVLALDKPTDGEGLSELIRAAHDVVDAWERGRYSSDITTAWQKPRDAIDALRAVLHGPEHDWVEYTPGHRDTPIHMCRKAWCEETREIPVGASDDRG